MISRSLQHGAVGKCSLRRKKTGLLVQDRTQELVCRAETFHQEVSLAFSDHLHSLGNRRKFHRVVNNGEEGLVDPLLLAGCGNHSLITDKRHLCKPHFHSL